MRNFILLAAVLFVGLVRFFPYPIDEKQQQEILAATVMISIKTPNWVQTAAATDEALPIPPDEYRTPARADGYVLAHGLGTLVAHDDETLLVTHDHWDVFDEALGTVMFWTADGAPIAEMDLHAFKQHLRYRDGGTMVLLAPAVVAQAVSGMANTLPANTLDDGESVLLAQRANGRVVVTAANVVAQNEKQGRPVVQLQTADGVAVVGGDSGGGVWLNGHLAATMWATVMMENTTSGEQRATDLSVAAVFDSDWERN